MIVAFSGSRGSGKDSTAQGLINRQGFKRIGLADKLKDICSSITGIPREDMDNPSLKEKLFDSPFVMEAPHLYKLIDILENDGFSIQEWGIPELFIRFTHEKFVSIRDILQRVGTDICRAYFADDIWLKYLGKQLSNPGQNIVVTDARFKNERDYLKSLGAILVLVKREGLNNKDSHVSENQLGEESDYDVIVHNNVPLIELQASISMWYIHQENRE